MKKMFGEELKRPYVLIGACAQILFLAFIVLGVRCKGRDFCSLALQYLWLPVGFIQWEAPSGERRAKEERS